MKTIFILQGPPDIGKDYLIQTLTNESYGAYIHDGIFHGLELPEKGPLSLYNFIKDTLRKETHLHKDCDFIFTTNHDLIYTKHYKLKEDGYKIILCKMEDLNEIL